MTCQKRGEKVKNRSSVNIDKTTLKDLDILSKKTGLNKKAIVQKLTRKELQKEACAH